jgi:hypothetical protein
MGGRCVEAMMDRRRILGFLAAAAAGVIVAPAASARDVAPAGDLPAGDLPAGDLPAVGAAEAKGRGRKLGHYKRRRGRGLALGHYKRRRW